MRNSLFLLTAVLFSNVIVQQAEAQSAICLAIANKIEPDVLVQGSNSQQFSQLQTLVRDDTYSDYNTASHSTLDGSINVPDEVDAFLSTKSDSSTWGQNRARFLSMDAQTAMSSASASTRISQVSVAALHEVEKCARDIAAINHGFAAVLEDATSKRDAFTVRLTNNTEGDPKWSLVQFSARPNDPKFKCADGFEKASMRNPIKLEQQTQVINCEKDPDIELTLAVQTTAGGSGASIILTSFDDEIQRLRDDMDAKISGLASKLDKHGMVMPFAAASCPAPWVPYQPAAGRFIRGIDPSGAVDPSGVRSVGSLQEDGIISHTHPVGINGGDSTTMVPGGASQRLPNYNPDSFGGGGTKQTGGNPGGLSETRPKNVALLYCVLN